MSKILVKEQTTLKVCELPSFMTLSESTKIKEVPGIKELLSIPCSEGEYQLVDDQCIFYKDGDKYFIYNMEDDSKKELDISLLEGERVQLSAKISALRKQRCKINEALDNGSSEFGGITDIVDINKELNTLRDRIDEIDKILHPPLE